VVIFFLAVGGQGVGLHQDTGFFTLLAPGDEAGLEVQLPTGEMLPVPADPYRRHDA
jgi:isopenicillin N synthase-like dioxygenase